MTAQSERVVVVVFDGAKARFFDRQPNGRLTALTEMESGLHRFNRETVSDKPGRSFSSAGSGRHAIEPKHDPHKMEKHNFVHALVEALHDGLNKGKFDRIVVVAPERSLGEFRSLAPSHLRTRVSVEVPKELTQFSEHELEARLAPYFTPAKGESGSPARA